MKFKRIYYEPQVLGYELGKKLQEKYSQLPWVPIQNHNNIEELRKRGNEDFVEMKHFLILGTRKTHKYVQNFKVSDYLVPFTSSGCSAMCLYCYLVCNYNKCSYLRIFVNKDQMMDLLIKRSIKEESAKTYEIGSNSDLILENRITGNLPVVIEQFAKEGKGRLTFPTKFSMVSDLLSLDHRRKTIFRMSVNPQKIIRTVEIGTSTLMARIRAVNEMFRAGYPVGIMIAPVILVEHWQLLYIELLDILKEHLDPKAQEQMMIEVIFMTYSYIHRAINDQAFPRALKLYNQELMTGRGRGRYCYKPSYRREAEAFLQHEITKRFDASQIVYIV